MKHYNSYMDRVQFPAIAHLELMEALERGAPTRRVRRCTGWAAGLAACGALALFLGTALWWQTGDPGVALRPGSGESPVANIEDTAQSTATPTPEANTAYNPMSYKLVVPPLPEGYAFTDEALDLPDLTGEDCYMIDWDYAPDANFQDLTAEQMLSIFGTDDPTTLATRMGMGDFTITGLAILQDTKLLDVHLTGVSPDSQSSFTLRLCPDEIPYMNENYKGYATWTENGVTLNGYSLYYDSDGDNMEEYHNRVFFESRGVGVYFEAVTPDYTLGQNLTKAVVYKGTGSNGGFTLDWMQSKYVEDVEPTQMAVERIHPIWGSPVPLEESQT